MSVLRWQTRHERPVHVYGHPERLGAMAEEVLPPLFELAKTEGLPTITLAEFYSWWARREATDMRTAFDPMSGELHISFHGGTELPIEIFAGDRDVIVRMSEHRYFAPAASRVLVTGSSEEGAARANVAAGARGERSC